MAQPLMPKATAVWLVENTALTFDQIAQFCGLHPLEVQGIADGEVATGIKGMDPIANAEVTREEIERCQKNPSAKLQPAKSDLPKPVSRTKGPKYTPIAKRQDKPDGIAWILRNHPEVKDAQICRLIGTTKNTIQAIRDRTHWNSPNIRQRDPVLLGLCTQSELNETIETARRQQARKPGEKQDATAETGAETAAQPNDDIPGGGGEDY
ncbi:DUF1013 domain-containing protein [Rhodovibrio salinarum]|uniref:DUF1013 domain-containing protein n=1 Tax=Rhodovibrio salinarum TaxID=1087 RepID=A0A934UZ31_9PROT|nr:cell cycle transcriptional regulator TrcR [Rhodovibrio salinarum]MBK1696074.1 DUF1013 domain-containing protein [Rhodovibrio salinarum]